MDDTQNYFDSVAGQWDDMRRQFFGEGVRRAAIAAAQIGPGSVVADVGTGTGFLAEAALEAGSRVIGIDASEGMLEQVRRRFSGKSFEARTGDVADLPLETDSTDAVLANMVLHHAPDPPRAIREMTRALKPGGTLVITDADSHTHEWLRTEQHDRWLGFDRAEIAAWFRDAGLQDVSVTDTHELCSPSSRCGTTAAITIFVACGRKPSAAIVHSGGQLLRSHDHSD
jgi:ubiquinone/menaquinone biosynthesis C-methylase UbiE